MILHVLDPDKYIGESYLEKERMIYDLNKHFIQFTRPKNWQDQRISFYFDIYISELSVCNNWKLCNKDSNY